MAERRARLQNVEDDSFLRKQIASHFSGRYEVLQAESRQEGIACLSSGDIDLVLLDMRLPPHTDSIDEGLHIAAEIHKISPGTLTIAMSGDKDRGTMVRAVETGVYDFFTKPLDINELEVIIRRALDRRQLDAELQRLRKELTQRYDFRNLKGNSPAMQSVKNAIRKVADSNANILIRGESGTGKELVARAIHFNSSRRDAPFVALNCSAFPEHLVEDELFGHEKGAFTGAVSLREGRFEMAHLGTLFLDELATLTPAIQAKLLRVLETRSFERLGGSETVRVDIRLVCATNQDLEKEVGERRFRQDLYYRVNVVSIQLPPLRGRKEDISMLAETFLEQSCRENNQGRKHFSQDALECLFSYEWKGNVRELEHLVESLVLLTEADTITAADLPPALREHTPSAPLTGVSLPDSGIVLERRVAEYERILITTALERTAGRKKNAAELLGLNKDQMKYLCRKYNL